MRYRRSEFVGMTVKGAVIATLVLMPIWLVVINSMKPLAEAQELGAGFPSEMALLENYQIAFEDGRYLRGLLNSAVVCTVSIGTLLFVGSLGAWVFARAKGRRLRVLFYLTVSGIVLPISIVTTIGVLRFLGLHGGLPGLVAVYIGTGISLTVFLVTGFVKTIPSDLEDSARIDGASEFTIFRRVIFPLLRPVHVAAGFILLITFWNDFFLPLFILQNSEDRTLPLGLFVFASAVQGQFRWDLIFAFLVLVSLPLVTLFILAQRWVTAGLSGAVKG